MRLFTPEVGIECIPPLNPNGDTVALDDQTRGVRARQLAHFVTRIHAFYMDPLEPTDPNAPTGLGLTRVMDPPYPDPTNPSDVAWRMDRIRQSGNVQRTGLQYIAAFALTKTGEISDADDAIIGLCVLAKPTDEETDEILLCTSARHVPTEILEWDVLDPAYKGRGLGKQLLREAVRYIHPDDEVIADVAQTNVDAFVIYGRYGFRRDLAVPPTALGVFDTLHSRIHTTGAALRHRLSPSY